MSGLHRTQLGRFQGPKRFSFPSDIDFEVRRLWGQLSPGARIKGEREQGY